MRVRSLEARAHLRYVRRFLYSCFVGQNALAVTRCSSQSRPMVPHNVRVRGTSTSSSITPLLPWAAGNPALSDWIGVGGLSHD